MIILAFIKANLRICHPSEILVFPGKKRKLKDGTVVGYRYIKGVTGSILAIMEQIKNATGLDIFDILQGQRGAITELQR